MCVGERERERYCRLCTNIWSGGAWMAEKKIGGRDQNKKGKLGRRENH